MLPLIINENSVDDDVDFVRCDSLLFSLLLCYLTYSSRNRNLLQHEYIISLGYSAFLPWLVLFMSSFTFLTSLWFVAVAVVNKQVYRRERERQRGAKCVLEMKMRVVSNNVGGSWVSKGRERKELLVMMVMTKTRWDSTTLDVCMLRWW